MLSEKQSAGLNPALLSYQCSCQPRGLDPSGYWPLIPYEAAAAAAKN